MRDSTRLERTVQNRLALYRYMGEFAVRKEEVCKASQEMSKIWLAKTRNQLSRIAGQHCVMASKYPSSSTPKGLTTRRFLSITPTYPYLASKKHVRTDEIALLTTPLRSFDKASQSPLLPRRHADFAPRYATLPQSIGLGDRLYHSSDTRLTFAWPPAFAELYR